VTAIAAATIAAYWPSLQGGFLWDDQTMLTKNGLIGFPDGLLRIWFTTQTIDYWPMTNSSFWLESRLWDMNPLGYHVSNIGLHIANCVLFWTLLRRLAIPGAWIAAMLFAVHPVNVESVAWIAERKNTLSMLFFLLSLLWSLDDSRRSRLLSIAAFALAMLSKGSVAILPLVMLLIAWWRRGVLTSRDWARSMPYFAIAVVLTAVNIWILSRGGGSPIRQVNIAERVVGAGAIIWFYLSKAVWPVHLAFVYPLWTVDSADVRWWLPLMAAAAVTASLWWLRQKPWARAVLFAWLYFVIALLPVMGFIDTPFMRYSLVGDHYQYLALLGPTALAGAARGRVLPA